MDPKKETPINIKHEVDEATVIIGKGTERVGPGATRRMLEERLDNPMSQDERAVYEKVYKAHSNQF